jgi:hypothetical protein
MLLSRHQNKRKNQDIKIGKGSLENVSQVRHFESRVTNQKLIQEEIKRRLNSGNASYHLVKNPLSSCLSKNMKIKIYKTNFACGSV